MQGWIGAFQESIDFMEQNLAEDLDIEAIAEKAALSPFYYQRIFGALCGMTVGEYIDPSIPADWDGFTVERTYRGCKLTIMVENPDHIQHGVKEIRVDGKRIDRENVPLLTDIILSGRTNASIQVTMGS